MQNLNVRDSILKFISMLPEVVSVKAYGSSIAFQSGYKENEKKQVDLIVIVDDIKEFYNKNLKMNGYMYKLIPKVYFRCAKSKNLRKHASICYTSHIKYDNNEYKMGVIEKKDVLDDLLNWKTFYIAGRFQKEMFTAVSDKEIEKANEVNRRNALVVALLLLDKKNPTLKDLYEKICSLSYMGDSRKTLKAEDPNKIKKLASGSKDYFDREYTEKTDLFTVKKDGTLKINEDKLMDSMKNLPSDLYEEIHSSITPIMSEEDVKMSIRIVITEYLTNIINTSSKGQTMKGILTTGPINSISYALAKLKKGRKKQ